MCQSERHWVQFKLCKCFCDTHCAVVVGVNVTVCYLDNHIVSISIKQTLRHCKPSVFYVPCQPSLATLAHCASVCKQWPWPCSVGPGWNKKSKHQTQLEFSSSTENEGVLQWKSRILIYGAVSSADCDDINTVPFWWWQGLRYSDCR